MYSWLMTWLLSVVDLKSYTWLWPYSKTCIKRPFSKRPKIGFQDQLSLNAGQKYCRMLQEEHSAIISTFIKLPFVTKSLFCLFLSGCFTQVILYLYQLNCLTLTSDKYICKNKFPFLGKYNLWSCVKLKRHICPAYMFCPENVVFLLRRMHVRTLAMEANTMKPNQTDLGHIVCNKGYLST